MMKEKEGSGLSLKAETHVNTAIRPGADAAEFAKPEALIEGKCRSVGHGHSEMGAGRAAPAELVHDLFHHPPPIAPPLRARQQVDVQMGGKGGVGFRAEIIGVMVPVMDLLRPSPMA